MGITVEITIRRSTPADGETLALLFRSGAAAGDLALGADDPGRIDLASSCGLVAEHEGRAIGYALAELIPPQGAGVARMSIFVKPEFRRRGIGRTLLHTAIDLAGRSGITTLFSGVVPKNAPALLLHKKCGFRAVGLVPQAGLDGGQPLKAVMLRLDCPGPGPGSAAPPKRGAA